MTSPSSSWACAIPGPARMAPISLANERLESMASCPFLFNLVLTAPRAFRGGVGNRRDQATASSRRPCPGPPEGLLEPVRCVVESLVADVGDGHGLDEAVGSAAVDDALRGHAGGPQARGHLHALLAEDVAF